MIDPEKKQHLEKQASTIRASSTALAMICFVAVFLLWVGTGLAFCLVMAQKVPKHLFNGVFTLALLATPVLLLGGRFIDSAGEILADLTEERIERAEGPASSSTTAESETPT